MIANNVSVLSVLLADAIINVGAPSNYSTPALRGTVLRALALYRFLWWSPVSWRK